MNGKSDGILEQVAWKCCGDSFYRSCCLLAFFFLFKTRLDVYLYNLLYGSCFGGAVRIDDLLRIPSNPGFFGSVGGEFLRSHFL